MLLEALGQFHELFIIESVCSYVIQNKALKSLLRISDKMAILFIILVLQ